ncbi:Zn-ribbon domain-containing OB-fold protein [Nitriliruptor alkaliphilus]|uniref:Zn-ribbon domain-containing OB-fold protein n=1 Tax=Nitriliruptor alkaliphilus TaxID=427918 RepID=UPI000697811A|nr:OB-fold domain-containing protein [Nitriliruptor alkaliphilus]
MQHASDGHDERTVRPAVEGWFASDPEPHLLGQRCADCATVVFPPRAVTCPNPACVGEELPVTPLSRTGRVWSYATNHYPPPAPYVPADPFEPITIAAVELRDEAITVLGQVAGPTDGLRVGAEVELEIGTLLTTDTEEHTVWRWRVVAPVRSGAEVSA